MATIEPHHLKTDEDRVIDMIKRTQEAERRRGGSDFNEQYFQQCKAELEKLRAGLPRIKRAQKRMEMHARASRRPR